jgi:hypothetical protein
LGDSGGLFARRDSSPGAAKKKGEPGMADKGRAGERPLSAALIPGLQPPFFAFTLD